MAERELLPGFDDRAPRDRYCDLILTGGVTSAIAYPPAIFVLAMAYRFNAIGGSSSGAGTAALAAAAEFRRRHGSPDGFRILLERTAAVADDVGDGRTGLQWLFQPAAQHRRLFRTLVPTFASPDDKVANLVSGMARNYLLPGALVATLLAACLWWLADRWQWSGIAIGAAVMFVWLAVTALASGALLLRDVARVVNDGYGLCSGLDKEDRAPHPPLTQWLHDLIQEIAGRQHGDLPLTFADLAGAPGGPRDTLGDLSAAAAESIRLQMYTANVTHGRPYVLPQPERADDDPDGEEDDPPLYFREREMRRLFPPSVVEFMKTEAGQPVNVPFVKLERPGNALMRWLWSTPGAVSDNDDPQLWRLPRSRLPIIVAARMSISFPVLFTAVPLWVIDRREARHGQPANDAQVAKIHARRCLFSDGGLCSNFPIHLFDSVVPQWPTFGISLFQEPTRLSGDPPGRHWYGKRKVVEGGGTVYLPNDHRDGREYRWNEFDYESGTVGRLAGFASALFDTTSYWNDATLARLPGVRDRVVQVGLNRYIGGLNILMTTAQIRRLAKMGGEAARLLLERFAAASRRESGDIANGWDEHRWVRFNVFWESLAESLGGLAASTSQRRYATPIGDLIRQAMDEAPLKGDDRTRLLAADAAALEGALHALIHAERVLTELARPGQPYVARPRPVMRVRPPL